MRHRKHRWWRTTRWAGLPFWLRQAGVGGCGPALPSSLPPESAPSNAKSKSLLPALSGARTIEWWTQKYNPDYTCTMDVSNYKWNCMQRIIPGWITHRTSRAVPLSVRNHFHWWIETMDVIGRGTGVTAEELAAVLTDATELHVVVLLLLLDPLTLLQHSQGKSEILND